MKITEAFTVVERFMDPCKIVSTDEGIKAIKTLASEEERMRELGYDDYADLVRDRLQVMFEELSRAAMRNME